MPDKVLVSLFIGSTIRLALYFAQFNTIFQKRVEVSTPTNSWNSMQEGLYLLGRGISPYSGDTFHETPLALLFTQFLIQTTNPLVLFSIFIFFDVLTALLLGLCVEKFKTFYLSKSQKSSKHTKSENGVNLVIKSNDFYGEAVTMAYFLNPFIIANCLGQTTTVFANFFLALTLFGMSWGFIMITSISLTLAIYQSLYPVVLIFPACICLYDKLSDDWMNASFKMKMKSSPPTLFKVSLQVVGCVVFVLSALLIWSMILCGEDWIFLDRTYGFILNVRDLKPNIGLFWYFFTEMFEHFHLLFICTFQINAFIYVIPLTIRFHKEPPLLIYALCTLMTIFKSYPCVGDVGFYLAFMPMWRHIFPFMQQKFLVGCFFIATTILAPIQWYLWIYSGSANANFYFGVTIAFGTAQIFLLTDILLAHLKREYFLENGIQKTLNGKPVGLSLM